MLPNLLILLGLALAAFGTFLKFSPTPIPASDPGQVEASAAPAPTAEAKGQAFENWVVDRLSKDFHKLREWRGDKISTQGTYAESNMRPDLEVELVMGGSRYLFAMECKWRQGFNGERMDVKEWQLTRYKRFAQDRQMHVFLVLGVGGTPAAPAELYTIPLLELADGPLTMAILAPYRQPMTGKSFYYDPFSQKLKF